MRSRFLCTADPPFPLSLQPLLLEAWLFQISRVSGIMQHLSSSDWSISLTMMSSRFIHIVAYGRIFFLRLNNILLYIYKYAYVYVNIYVYTYYIFFIHLSIYGYLSFPSLDSVQFSRSVVSDSLRPHEPRGTPGLPVHHQLLESTQTHVHWVGDAIQPSHPLCHPLVLLPSIFPNIRVFSNESALCIRWPEYWSFSFNISPSNEHPGLTSFRLVGWIKLQWTWQVLGQCHCGSDLCFSYE